MAITPLNTYQAKNANWRELLRKNQQKTRLIIFSYILIYVLLGLLVDLFLYGNQYPQVPFSTLFHALITFKIVPYATIIACIVAIISLLITYSLYDKLMLLGTEYREINSTSAESLEEKQLYNIIEELRIAAGLRYMPKVFIIEADYMNAFASGYSEKSAMVAITRGLLVKLTRSELQAVMAHEISHIRHLDIKVTLMAAVLSNLMLILLDILFYSMIFGRNRRDREGGSGNGLFMIILLLRYLLPLITLLLMLYLSRTREYMADAGCVELTRDNTPLAQALLKIQEDHENNQERYAQEYQSTPHEAVRREAYIFDPTTAGISPRSSLSDIFSTHPSISKRLEALGFKNSNSSQ